MGFPPNCEIDIRIISLESTFEYIEDCVMSGHPFSLQLYPPSIVVLFLEFDDV